jgi:AraC family transcriptional regulator
MSLPYANNPSPLSIDYFKSGCAIPASMVSCCPKDMKKTNKLTNALGYLEDSLDQGVTAESVARFAGFTQSHLTRTFEALFGVGPDEYISRRRLDPERWPSLRSLSERGFADISGMRIMDWPQFYARGLMITTTAEDNRRKGIISAFWQRVVSSEEILSLIAKTGCVDLLGVCWDYNPSDSSFSYGIAVEAPHVASFSSSDSGVTILVPASTYAVFPIVGELPEAIETTRKAIYGEWFPVSGYEHAGTPEFEAFRIPGTDASPRTNELLAPAIWIPIRECAD